MKNFKLNYNIKQIQLNKIYINFSSRKNCICLQNNFLELFFLSMKAYKTEVKLNKEQEKLYKLTISACRFVWNLFISVNKERYSAGEKYLNNYEFSKWFNNVYLKENEDKHWLKEAGSKALRKTIDNCNSTYQKAFKSKKGFPKFKKASKDKTGVYFVRVEANRPIRCSRHKIKIPMFGEVSLKEKGYLPTGNNKIISGVITKRSNRYFISVITDEESSKDNKNCNEGIGIDWGISTFLTCSNKEEYKNINKTTRVKKLEKKLRREQRALSRKYEAKKKEKRDKVSNNYIKNKLRVEKVYYRLEQIRNSYTNKCIDNIVKGKPRYVTVENLNIKGMVRNKHLSKTILQNKPYYFKQVLVQKCTKHNIEVREVNKFFPSSKLCSSCGEKNKELKLKDRNWKCSNCGAEHQRDYNAAVNLKNCKDYILLNEVRNTCTDGLSGTNFNSVRVSKACGVLKQTQVVVASNNKREYNEARKSELVTSNVIVLE